jgi:hypothetical protein
LPYFSAVSFVAATRYVFSNGVIGIVVMSSFSASVVNWSNACCGSRGTSSTLTL